MRFVPRQPREGINVSAEHPLVEAGTLLLGLTAVFAVVAVVLYALVDIALIFVSEDSESALFSRWQPEDLVAAPAGDERSVATRRVLERLVQHWPEARYRFRLELSDATEPNAMAFPGGLIVVTRGLLEQVESENELAFVLGHELGHFRHRDHLRMLGRGLVASLAFGLVLGQDAGGLGLSVAGIASRSFDRAQESAADRLGLELVNAEYGHVAGSWRFLERLQDDAADPRGLAGYLATHPSSAARVAALREYAAAQDWEDAGALTGLPW